MASLVEKEHGLDANRLSRLLEVGRSLVAELDQRIVLDRVLEVAREVTGARFAALGIINEERTELEQFLTLGIDRKAHRAIGNLPRGRGVLGVLIDDPRPLRLSNVGQHAHSYGFPAGHPVMLNFLGVPILIRGQAWGNLYLTEKQGSDFTDADEEAVVILAEWAAIAIENARLFEVSERRREELEQAVHGLEATRDIALALGGETELDRVLELIVKRARALVEAHSLVIMLRDGDDLVVAAGAGHVVDLEGIRVPISGSTSGEVLARGRPERIADVSARLRVAHQALGVPDAKTALMVPLIYRSEAMGVLIAFDRGPGREPFTEEDEQSMRAFAASAATAVALAQTVRADRLRSSMAAADEERRRWARELHDETLQGLAGLRVLLSSAVRRGDPDKLVQAATEAIGQLEHEIESLRAIIAELRPASLDELGLQAAIETLLDRHRAMSGLEVEAEFALGEGELRRLHPDLETTIYRVVQEALTNVAKHARATRVHVRVRDEGRDVTLEVHDDGVGFDVEERASAGYGLGGMHERVGLAGGRLSIESPGRGARVRAQLPARYIEAAGPEAEGAAGLSIPRRSA